MSTLTSPRVHRRITPYPAEDIHGYLVRVCEVNHYKGVEAILTALIPDRRSRALRISDLSALAHFCRNTAEEIQQLSGVERRGVGGDIGWEINGSIVTRANFVASSATSVCPDCLQEAAYARGVWSLTFYLACAQHSRRMIVQCPACARPLKRHRRRIRFCDCGCDLATVETQRAPAELRLVSGLLADQPLCREGWAGHPIPIIERLADLSMDGLCKTLWFFGHCVAGFDQLSSGHGRVRPGAAQAERIILQCFAILADWPESLGEALRRLARRPKAPGSAALIDRLLGPLQHYLYEVIDADELSFVKLTYEHYIRQIWRELNASGRTKAFSPQLELPL